MNKIIFENRQIRLVTPLGPEKIALIRAQVDEEISALPAIHVEFVSHEQELDPAELIGKRMTIEIDTDYGPGIRYFGGVCIALEYSGEYQGFAVFQAQLRPRLWFLTRNTDCRIFQKGEEGLTIQDIIKQILEDRGITDYRFESCGTLKRRLFTVQYNETDFDFISRLMEEEGVFYVFEYQKDKETLIFSGSSSSHRPIPGKETVQYLPREADFRRKDDHIFEWRAGETRITDEMLLNDFNFEEPSTDLMGKATDAEAPKQETKFYHYPAKFAKKDEGARIAKLRLEALAAMRSRSRGHANLRSMTVGARFEMTGHPRKRENGEYITVRVTHQLQIDSDYDDSALSDSVLGGTLGFSRRTTPDTYRCVFEAQPASVPFRPQQRTRRPHIPGIQTAVVVGKSGEEIHADRYGRVKVRFHWDHHNTQKDETASCWIRYAVPWSGKKWGWVGVPRIGQEVVVQFEEGDPDRPMITGMLYNSEAMPTYDLPANLTQLGFKSNSSKGGGGANELMFEDRKDAELVRLVAERDYEQTVKNNATVKIGLEKADAGDLTHEVKNDVTETIGHDHTYTLTNNHTETIEQGSRTTTLRQGNLSLTLDRGDMSTKLAAGNQETSIQQGNMTTKLGMGNQTTTLDMGNVTIKASMGKITMEAMQGIELKVGANSIKIDMSGVTISGTLVKINANAMLEAKGGAMTKIEGGGMLMAKGGIVLIN